MGCFVVLRSDSGSPDEFRVLLWSDTSEPTVTAMISVPPSTYTLYVYDLEEDGHVNREPAILPQDRIFVTTESKLTDNHMRYTYVYMCICLCTLFIHNTISQIQRQLAVPNF